MQDAPAPHPKTEAQVDPLHTACTSPYVPNHSRGGTSQKVQHIFVLRDGSL